MAQLRLRSFFFGSVSVAPARTVVDRMTALAEAGDGTLCLLHSKLKYRELIAISLAVLPLNCLTHIVVCTTSDRAKEIPRPPIVIPPLDSRKADLDRLIEESIDRAAERLYCTGLVRLSSEDRAWLRARACGSLRELQTATLRLVAVREAGSIHAGSALLGISHVALTNWLNSRGFAKLEAAHARKPGRTRKPGRIRTAPRSPARRSASRRASSS